LAAKCYLRARRLSIFHDTAGRDQRQWADWQCVIDLLAATKEHALDIGAQHLAA
jgi:hypothetical protein